MNWYSPVYTMNWVFLEQHPLEVIRETTKKKHIELESRLGVGREDATVADYGKYCLALWHWLKPIEAKIWSGGWCAELEPEQRSGKCEWLRADIESIYGSVPACESVETVSLDSEAEKIGVAYVIEGSMLGGQVLRKRLEDVLPFEPVWLEGYGKETGRNWTAFKKVLSDSLKGQETIAAAEAADEAFMSLGRAFEQVGALR